MDIGELLDPIRDGRREEAIQRRHLPDRNAAYA
jgi:hypothetical protein